MRMGTRISAVLAAVLASALVAACGDEPPQPRVSANPPQPATGAAAGSSTSPEKLPTPKHDARTKKNGD